VHDLRYLRESPSAPLVTVPVLTVPPNHHGCGDDEVNRLVVARFTHKNGTAADSSLLYVTDDPCVAALPLPLPAASPLPAARTYNRLAHLPPSLVTALAVRPSPPGSRSLDFATGGTDCAIHLHDGAKGGAGRPMCSVKVLPYEDGDAGGRSFNPPHVHALSFSETKGLLAAGAGDATVRLYEVTRGKKGRGLHQSAVLTAHSTPVNSVAFHGDLLLSSSNGGLVCAHDMNSGQVKRAVQHGRGINQVEGGAGDGGWCWVAGESLTLYVLD
jgi:WD40 repeat protein